MVSKTQILGALLLGLNWASAAQAAEPAAQVTIPVPAGATFTAKRLENPDRIYVDIEGAWQERMAGVPAAQGSIVKGIRSAMRTPEVKRVVLDLAGPARFQAAHLANPERLVLKIKAEGEPRPAPAPAAAVAAPAPVPAPPPVTRALQPEPAPVQVAVQQQGQAKEEVESQETGSTDEPEPPAPQTPAAAEPAAPAAPAAAATEPAEPPVYAIATVPDGPRKLVVLQGMNAFNNISTKSATEPVVEVRDERDLPVRGAEVLFELPTKGASGLFPEKSLQLRTRTNEQGQAVGSGFLPNNIPGKFEIHVTTGKASQAAVFIPQRNVVDDRDAARIHASTWRRKRTWIGLGISAGASVGLILAMRSGNGSAAAGAGGNSLSITPGPINIGGLR